MVLFAVVSDRVWVLIVVPVVVAMEMMAVLLGY